MLYCPNCSAYQKDQTSSVCHRCGFDFTIEEQRRLRRAQEAEEEEIRKFTEGLRTYDRTCPCPVCGEPTVQHDEEVEHNVEGKRLPMSGMKLMGGDITKKAVTQISFSVSGRLCRQGHRSFTSFTSRERPLCPMCYDKMIRYGTSILSCPRCNRHFPMDAFETMDHEEALTAEGWIRSEGQMR